MHSSIAAIAGAIVRVPASTVVGFGIQGALCHSKGRNADQALKAVAVSQIATEVLTSLLQRGLGLAGSAWVTVPLRLGTHAVTAALAISYFEGYEGSQGQSASENLARKVVGAAVGGGVAKLGTSTLAALASLLGSAAAGLEQGSVGRQIVVQSTVRVVSVAAVIGIIAVLKSL